MAYISTEIARIEYKSSEKLNTKPLGFGSVVRFLEFYTDIEPKTYYEVAVFSLQRMASKHGTNCFPYLNSKSLRHANKIQSTQLYRP